MLNTTVFNAEKKTKHSLCYGWLLSCLLLLLWCPTRHFICVLPNMGCFAWICLMQFILFYSLCLYSFVKHWEPNSTLPAQINILVSSLITPKKTILFNCSVCHLLYRCNCFRATHKYLCKLRKDGIIWTWGSCISIRVVAASQNYICARNRSKYQIMREVVISERIKMSWSSLQKQSKWFFLYSDWSGSQD